MGDSKNSLIAQLNGGLGNQLFILAAGLEQARRLDTELFLDLSAYQSKSAYRSFELEELSHLFSALHSGAAREHKLLPPQLLRRSRFFTKYTFRERSAVVFDPRIYSIKRGTTLKGYFQSPKYFTGVAAELASELNRLSPPQVMRRGLSIGVHLRRGDYLSDRLAQFHGLVSPGYIRQALQTLKALGVDERVEVFSDDIDLARRELEPVLPSAVFVPPGDSPLGDLLSLAGSTHLIMSNSSFSWWAGWLVHQRGGYVIAPRPWFLADSAATDLLLPSWLSIGARGH